MIFFRNEELEYNILENDLTLYLIPVRQITVLKLNMMNRFIKQPNQNSKNLAYKK